MYVGAGGRGGGECINPTDSRPRLWMRVSGQRHSPAAPCREESYPLDRRLGGPQEPVSAQRLEGKSFFSCRGSNTDRPVVQSVVRHYTDWATPAPRNTG
jgi:hypothetical protein